MPGTLKPFTAIQALGRLIGKRRSGQALQSATARAGADTPSETGLAQGRTGQDGLTRSRSTFQFTGTEGQSGGLTEGGKAATGIARLKRKRKRKETLGFGSGDTTESPLSL